MERMDNGWRDFPECRAKIDELPSTYLKRLYYDTVNFNPHMLRMVHEMMGADRMVLGSDYPHLLGSIDRAVSSIESLEIPEADKRKIFAGTALRILNNA
jgi:aminocarboxymuconate-semialdehyde decarboxylase